MDGLTKIVFKTRSKKNKPDKNYGTTFWDCDEKNYSNEHLEDLEKN